MSRILYISERVFVNSIFWAEQGIHRKFKSRKSAAYRRGPEGYRQKKEAVLAESAITLTCRSAGAAYRRGPEGYRQKKEAASAESAIALTSRSAGAAYRRGPKDSRKKEEAVLAESAITLTCRRAGAAECRGPEGYRQKKEAASAEPACALSRKADAAERAGGTKAVGIRENVWRHGPAPAPRPPLSAARRGRPACGRTNRAPVVPHRYQIPLPFSEKIVKIALHRARTMVN